MGAALSSNLLVTLLIPFAIAGLVFWWSNAWRGRVLNMANARAITLGTVAFCAVALAFAVLRNLAVGAWLAP